MKLKLISCFITLFITLSAFANATHIKNRKSEIAPAGALTGTVTDKANGTPLPGVTISVPDLHTGTVTDANGCTGTSAVNVQAADNTAPKAVCKNFTTYLYI